MILDVIPAVPIADHQPGDRWQRVGMKMRQYRNEVLIATHDLVSVTQIVEPQYDGTGPITSFLVEQNMPGIISTLTDVVRAGEVIRFKFAGGTEREFADLPSALAAVEHLDTDETVTQNVLILKTIRNSPDGANLENILGASCSADFNANNPLVLTVE